MVWFLTVSSNSFIKTQNKIDIFCAAVFGKGLALGHYLPFPLLIKFHEFHLQKSSNNFHATIICK